MDDQMSEVDARPGNNTRGGAPAGPLIRTNVSTQEGATIRDSGATGQSFSICS